MTTRHVALVGLMGAGKSSVGRLLAARLGVAFVDLDDAIAATRGASVQQIFDAEGEAVFRDLEAAALGRALAGPVAVIATGGGVVERPSNRDALAAAHVVWLRADPAVLAARVGDGAGRPLLAAGVLDRLQALAERREGWYEQVADVVVDVDDLDLDAVVDRVAAALEQREPVT